MMGKRSRNRKGKSQGADQGTGSSLGCFGLVNISYERFQELLHCEEIQLKYKTDLANLEEERNKQSNVLKEYGTTLLEKDRILATQVAVVEENNRALLEKEKIFARQTDLVEEMKRELVEKDEFIAKQKELLKKYEADLLDRDELIEDQADLLMRADEEMGRKMDKITSLELAQIRTREAKEGWRVKFYWVQSEVTRNLNRAEELEELRKDLRMKLKTMEKNYESQYNENKLLIERLQRMEKEREESHVTLTDIQTLLADIQAKADFTKQHDKERIRDLIHQTHELRSQLEAQHKELARCRSDTNIHVEAADQSHCLVTRQVSAPSVLTTVFSNSKTAFNFGDLRPYHAGCKSRSFDSIQLEREVIDSQVVALQCTNSLLRTELAETTTELEKLRALHKQNGT